MSCLKYFGMLEISRLFLVRRVGFLLSFLFFLEEEESSKSEGSIKKVLHLQRPPQIPPKYSHTASDVCTLTVKSLNILTLLTVSKN